MDAHCYRLGALDDARIVLLLRRHGGPTQRVVNDAPELHRYGIS
jgi:hypothetical protein